MAATRAFRIAVLPGDGIGPEVMTACTSVLRSLAAEFAGFDLQLAELEAGAELYSRTGVALPEETFDQVCRADAILFGAMGLPDVRASDGREIVPQLELRERLELFAGVRPLRPVPGLPLPLADPRARDLDVVLVREVPDLNRSVLQHLDEPDIDQGDQRMREVETSNDTPAHALDLAQFA